MLNNSWEPGNVVEMLKCQVMLSYLKCLCWSLGLLFSCLCSKVTVYDCLSCYHAVMSCCHAVICQVLMLITGTCWTTFVFMSMLKSHCLWLFVMLSCCHVMLSCCHMSSVYVDHWDMLNNFCFHLYAQKSQFMIVCHAVMSWCHDVIWHMSYVKCIMLILGIYSTSFVFMSRLKTQCL